jgi:hypothetical protein
MSTGTDCDSIALRVVAKHVAKNPNAALEAAGQRHQVSELKEELTQTTRTKQKVLAVGEKLLRELVRCKRLIAPWRSEGEVLLEVLSFACGEALGSQWTQADVDEIRDWCVKQSGGSVVGQLRLEVVRNAVFRNQEQMDLGA